MSTMHCQCNECKKHQQHHSFCGCKGGFKDHDFFQCGHHFSFQGHHMNQSCKCHSCANKHFQGHHMNHSCKCDHCMNGRSHGHFTHHCLCSDQFSVRLGGLRSSLAFRLRQMIGCKVKVTFEEGNSIQGKIAFVGRDYVEIVSAVQKDKNKEACPKKAFLIQFDKIKWVELMEKQ